jgi:hypothetical protein
VAKSCRRKRRSWLIRHGRSNEWTHRDAVAVRLRAGGYGRNQLLNKKGERVKGVYRRRALCRRSSSVSEHVHLCTVDIDHKEMCAHVLYFHSRFHRGRRSLRDRRASREEKIAIHLVQKQ